MSHCIYFLSLSGVVVYIGYTSNLENRLIAHKAKKYDTVRSISVPDRKTGLRYERRWIMYFKPKYNRFIPKTLTPLKPTRTLLIFELDTALLKHLKKHADKKEVTVSRLVRAALRKVTNYKDEDIV